MATRRYINGDTLNAEDYNALLDVVENLNDVEVPELRESIPTKTSQLTNDSGFITESSDTWRPIKMNGTQVLGSGITTGALNLRAGSNITLTQSNGTITIASTGGGGGSDTHRPIQMNDVEILGNNTTPLNLSAGTNISLANNNGKVTISTNETLVKVVRLTQLEYDDLINSGTVDETTLYIIIQPSIVTATFVDYNGDILQETTLNAGEIPVYTGETPTRDEYIIPGTNRGIDYIFSGWTPEIGAIHVDTVYTAQYDEIEFIFEERYVKENISNISEDKDYLLCAFTSSLATAPTISATYNNSGWFNSFISSDISITVTTDEYFVIDSDSPTKPTTFIKLIDTNDGDGTYYLRYDEYSSGTVTSEYLICPNKSSGSNVFSTNNEPHTDDSRYKWKLEEIEEFSTIGTEIWWNSTYSRFIRYNGGSPRLAPYRSGQTIAMLYYRELHKNYPNTSTRNSFRTLRGNNTQSEKPLIISNLQLVISDGPDEEDREINSMR